MNYFTTQNTFGYSNTDLIELNRVFELELADEIKNNKNFDEEQLKKHLGEKILFNYDKKKF